MAMATYPSASLPLLPFFFFLLLPIASTLLTLAQACDHPESLFDFASSSAVRYPLPLATRRHWMQRAVDATTSVSGPCPSAPFAAVFVDHSASPRGLYICNGTNESRKDPTLHGEIAAVRNCIAQYQPASVALFFSNLTLYTTAEPCPMCMSALRWAGVREVIYGTSIPRLVELGWEQIDIRAEQVNARSEQLRSPLPFLRGNILTNVTDPLFAWQWSDSWSCPAGCVRDSSSFMRCVPEGYELTTK